MPNLLLRLYNFQKHRLDYFEEDCRGGYVENALGVFEIVALPTGYWDYLEWMHRAGHDADAWIKMCDRQRGSFPLGKALADWIWQDFARRQEEGLPLPEWA